MTQSRSTFDATSAADTDATRTAPEAAGRLERPIPFRFNVHELSGSLGDLGTFLPLVVGMALVAPIDLGMVFICAGVLNIVTGWLFRQPIPVQPMKALAAIAIAEGLGLGPVVAAGMLMGIALLVLSLSGAVDLVARLISKPLVRGIQLCIGLSLIIKGAGWVIEQPRIGWDSWLTAIICAIALPALVRGKQPALLYAFAAGFVLLWFANPQSYAGVTFTLPQVSVHWPQGSEWWSGLVRGAVPQLPLTLLNSVVAVCALSADYFPAHGIAPRRMAGSVALMNLLTVPLSGVPMCHGAGGLAGQYRFGARTGGSVIILGVAKILVGLLFGSAIVSLLAAYPKSILGLMLVAAGWSLGSVALDTRGWRGWLIVVVSAVVGLLSNVAVGLAAGAVIVGLLRLLERTQVGARA